MKKTKNKLANQHKQQKTTDAKYYLKKKQEIGGNVAGSMMHNSKYCNAMIRLNIIPKSKSKS